MSKKETGGPAYPSRSGMMFYVPGEHKEAIQHTIEAMDREHEGMQLRDYFAAKAMQSLILLPDYVNNWPSDITARDAYQFADAMITERSKGE